MSEPRPPSSPEPRPDTDLARDLDRLRDATEGEALDALFRKLEAEAASEDRSLLARLRATSTAMRRTLAVVSFAAIALFTYVTTRRPDFALYPKGRLVAESLAYAILLGGTLVLALRPQHEPALRPRAVFGLTALTLVTAVVLAVLPAPHEIPIDLVGAAVGTWARDVPCVGFGLLLGLPVYFVARLLDRGTSLSSVLAAAAAGLMGNLALELHCPSVDAHHRLAAHASIGFVFLFSLGLAYGLEFYFSRRARNL